MAKEILAIPEEKISEVVLIIRRGLAVSSVYISENVSNGTIKQLEKWCDKYGS